MMELDTIGKRIKYARFIAGFTQVELARAIRAVHAQISMWEHGKISPSIRSGHKLAMALQVSPAWLFFGEGNKPQ